MTRRNVLQSAAILTLLPLPGLAAPAPGTGKPGEFDWLAGEWKIANRKRKADGSWDEFPGEATCWTILGGVGSVEELRIPARDFSGMGLRLLDMDKRVWSDFWVNAKSGALGTAGLTGGFANGEGIFESEDTVDGKRMVYRGVWDRIVPGKSHRWYQAASSDQGKSWDVGWMMDWTRA
ncbi:hypothetical protein P1X14_16175 [Sphingomonas sp. AOB5]|uniref:hypothetical protein n=1 Tax=Sphingomonas sp. AOB5 TaxID=3034017 RepID=UPI0023FA3E4A|nr:hypothetical protein [Sphingomonas sp. AOB5]MDF7776794.1 hypothetical protein [Sphingomonas sp. AOB5]